MNRLIQHALKTEPGRRVEVQILMNLVTSSLGMRRQRILMMPSAQALEVFAAFTAEHLALSSDEQKVVLHKKALQLGRNLRKCLVRRDDEAVCRLIFQMYSNIGISMDGAFPGKVRVGSCYFCKHYSPEICAVASLMDSGVISGLLGGGKLEFTQRLTEGNDCCLCELKRI